MKIEKMNVRRSGVGWLISLLVVSVFLFNPWSIYAGDSAADTFERVDKVFAGFNSRKVSRAAALGETVGTVEPGYVCYRAVHD